MKQHRRILVAQLARFGDFLQTTPLLSLLKAQQPEVRLSVLVNTAQAGLAGANPEIDEVLAVDLGELSRLARSRANGLGEKLIGLRDILEFLGQSCFDRVINLNTTRPAALLTELVKAEQRSGPRLGPDRRRLLTEPWAGFIMQLMSDRRLIRFNLVDLLTGYAGPVPRRAAGLTYIVSDQTRNRAAEMLGRGTGPLIGFQLGSRHTSRQWPPENFARLAACLIQEENARIVFLGTDGERPLGLAVFEQMNKIAPGAVNGVLDLMGRTTLEELGGIVAALDRLVTTDTGTMHLAAALKTPILGLFMGPAFCHETGPYGEGHVILQAVAPCSPCLEGKPVCDDFFCRKLIAPELVFQTMRRLLGSDPDPLPESMPGNGVQALVTEFDDFGATCQPLSPLPLDKTGLLALAYREAGRGLIRRNYRIDQKKMTREFHRYAPFDFGDCRKLTGVLTHWRDILGREGTKKGLQIGLEKEEMVEPGLEPLRKVTVGLIGRGEREAAVRLADDMRQVITLAESLTE